MALIDSAPAMARQTARMLAWFGSEAVSSVSSEGCGHRIGPRRRLFYTSGDVAAFTAMVKRLLPFVGEDLRVDGLRWWERCLEPWA